MTDPRSIVAALTAALLFGASTPVAKLLTGHVAPVMLAGLLYLGSGVGLWAVRLLRRRPSIVLSHSDWRWLLASIAVGGVAGPVLLMQGLTQISASDAALLLNLETVFTAVLAWIVFGENAGRRVLIGMLLIVAGGVALAWSARADASSWRGVAAIALACLCWALDNNWTRKVAAAEATFIAGSKGLIAGCTSIALALLAGAALPSLRVAAEAMGVGLLGYGVSLVLFVIALRGLGAARSGAYFATAPFMGAVIALVALHEPTPAAFWLAAALMGLGVWLHLSEHHEHAHAHEALAHAHVHVHDMHHQHEHEFPWDGSEPHTHAHQHGPLTHRHAHNPDLHHHHRH